MSLRDLNALNQDIILICFELLCDDVKSLVALSSVSKRFYDLSLCRPVWGRVYDLHSLSTAFGSKSRHSADILKKYVLRYSKAMANLESSSPKVVSWNFFPTLKKANSTLLFSRFLFQVTSDTIGRTYNPVVSCYDMDDSLRLLWEKAWPGWGKMDIRSSSIDHNGPVWEVSVLLQAARRNILDLRTFRIEQNGQSIQLCEAGSQVLGIHEPGHIPYIHQEKWILRSIHPPYLTNMDKPKCYIDLPPDSFFDESAFVGKGHILIWRHNVLQTTLDLFRLPELDQHGSDLHENLELLADERITNLTFGAKVTDLQHLPQSRSHFDPLSNTPATSFLCSSSGKGYLPVRRSILNILDSPPGVSPSIDITEIDARMLRSAEPSLYCTWVFGFSPAEPEFGSQVISVYLSKLLPRPGGGPKFGTVKEVFLPVGLDVNPGAYSELCVFDEFVGRLYFATNDGIYVIDFA